MSLPEFVVDENKAKRIKLAEKAVTEDKQREIEKADKRGALTINESWAYGKKYIINKAKMGP